MATDDGKSGIRNTRHEWVRVGDIKVGVRFQREIEWRWVHQIAENFDPDLFGTPLLAKVGEELHAADGQHRILALREMGWNDQDVFCEVGDYEYERAAEIHVERDRKRRRRTAYDNFKGLLEARHPTQVHINKILENRGLQVAKNAKNDGDIGAVAMLERIYQMSPDLLEEVLDVCQEAWGNGPEAFSGDVMKALALLLTYYGDIIKRDLLVAELAKTTPHKYMSRGRDAQASHRAQYHNAVMVAMGADYNAGKRAGKQVLPNLTDFLKPRGGPSKKLSMNEREQVKELIRQSNIPLAEIAERYDVSVQTVTTLAKTVKRKRKRAPSAKKKGKASKKS